MFILTRKCNSHGKVSVICQSLKPEQGFEFSDRTRVVDGYKGVKFVDNAINTWYTVLRS